MFSRNGSFSLPLPGGDEARIALQTEADVAKGLAVEGHVDGDVDRRPRQQFHVVPCRIRSAATGRVAPRPPRTTQANGPPLAVCTHRPTVGGCRRRRRSLPEDSVQAAIESGVKPVPGPPVGGCPPPGNPPAARRRLLPATRLCPRRENPQAAAHRHAERLPLPPCQACRRWQLANRSRRSSGRADRRDPERTRVYNRGGIPSVRIVAAGSVHGRLSRWPATPSTIPTTPIATPNPRLMTSPLSSPVGGRHDGDRQSSSGSHSPSLTPDWKAWNV